MMKYDCGAVTTCSLLVNYSSIAPLVYMGLKGHIGQM